MSEIKVLDGDGNPKYYQTVMTGATGDGFLPIPANFLLEVAKGNVVKHTMWNAMGERVAVGTTIQGEDLWRGNDLTPAPTSHLLIPTPNAAGEQMTFVSEDDADNGATATGILTIKMHYLDATGDEQTETITLNGTTPVNTSAVNIRFINCIYALTVGSNGAAVGHIKVYKTGTVGLVYNMIYIGGNKSLVPHRMVPLGHTLQLVDWHAEEAQGKRANFRIRSTDMYGTLIPGVFCFKDSVFLKSQASGTLPLGAKIPALSIVKVSAWAILSGAGCGCGWRGILVED